MSITMKIVKQSLNTPRQFKRSMTSSSAAIAKFDLDTLTKFQEEIHIPSDEDEEITSNFYREFRKTTWVSHIPSKMKANCSDTEVSFTANTTFHYLINTFIRQTFPALRVKKEYENDVQIAWPHNLGTNSTPKACFKIDDDTLQTIDYVWFDIHSQFFMKPGFRDHWNMCVGNLPMLENWTNFLPEFTSNVRQPWFYGKDFCMAVPMFLSSLSLFEHVYTIRPFITDLLRMRVKKGDGWIETMCNLKCLDGTGPNGQLRPPELWGRYGYLHPTEFKWNKCREKHTFYIEDVIACDSVIPSSYGSVVTVQLDCKTPCKAFYWVAENLSAKENRNFSDYTTNKDNMYQGWNPIRSRSLMYSGNTRLEMADSDHSDKIEPWDFAISPPSEAGYNMYSFACNPNSLDAEVGIVMNGMSVNLLCTLDNTDPYLKPVKNTEDKSILDELRGDKRIVYNGTDKFIVKVRLLVTKKLTFSQDPKDKDKYNIIV